MAVVTIEAYPGRERLEEAEHPTISGYEIVRPLAHGGMGVVYLAWQSALERFVAIKVLRPEWREDAEVRALFVREARALSQVQHPHVVPVHAFGEDGPHLYLSMAYVLGETISEALDAARRGESRVGFWFERQSDDGRRANVSACLVAQAIADALDDLHSVRLVHRDVKPANIVVDAKGRPMLVDFGLARDPDAPPIRSAGGSAGRPRYLAPELLVQDPEVDPAADIYALGLTLFEMLTLRHGFPQSDAGDLVDAIRHGDLPSARDVDPTIPRSLEAIVARATALDPKDRYRSARGMSAALQAAKADLIGEVGMSTLALAPDIQRAVEDPARGDRRRWSRALLATLGGAALFGAGLLAGR